MSYIKIIEENHLKHFQFFPAKVGIKIQSIASVTVINSRLYSSMFNIAFGGVCSENKADIISRVKEEFSGNPFAWWIPPSLYSEAFSKLLLQSGFIIENTEYAMLKKLDDGSNFSQKTMLNIKQIQNKKQLEDFIDVIKVYDPCVQIFYNKLQDKHLCENEKLVVGYINEKPVSIGILFLEGQNAGIFSLITKEEYQCRGYGTDMMYFLLNLASENNCKTVTLSASSESGYKIYKNLGFIDIGIFECFEYKV